MAVVQVGKADLEVESPASVDGSAVLAKPTPVSAGLGVEDCWYLSRIGVSS